MNRDALLNWLSGLSARRLPLLVILGPPGSGKSALIQELSQAQKKAVFSLNQLLSGALLPIPVQERPYAVKPWLEKFLLAQADGLCFFDPCEILWEPSLRLQPLVLLQQVCLVRPLVVTLSGELQGSELTLAKPGHPEYCILKMDNIAFINMPEELCNL